MSTENDEFEPLSDDFLYELFKAALTNKDALHIVIEHLQSNFLPENVWKDIFNEIRTQVIIENKIPTVGTLQLFFRNNRDALLLLKEIKGIDVPDLDSLLSSFENYIRQVKFVELYDECGKLYQRNKRKEALVKFIDGSEDLKKIDLVSQKFESVFGDFAKRQLERENTVRHTDRIPFGIDGLDDKTNGGAETTEFVLFLGDAKSGKSTLATHLGINSARRGFHVAHFQLEGTKKQCLDRYDAAWSGVLYHEIKRGDFPIAKYENYKKIINSIGKADIHVDASEKFLSTSMVEIRQKLLRLKRKYDIKLCIIDYLDLLVPDHNGFYKDEKQKQQTVARMMKDLAVEQNVLVISFTQASSIPSELLNDPDFVIRREHLSEDKGKVRPVDMLITLNQTADERKMHEMRLFTEALREYESNDVILIKQSLKYSRFYDRKSTLEAFELAH